MTPPGRFGDQGQAFPIYITVVGGLLLLALAYFAVGQAAANRNGAQTAADAAALAAAQDTRDQLAAQWRTNLGDPGKWQKIFDGNVTVAPSCWRAHQLAGQNGARVRNCEPTGPLGYRVEVENAKAVGKSIVPGTERQHAQAWATAVIQPLCAFQLPEPDAEPDTLPRLACEDGDWDLDPEDTGLLPEPQDLFDVHLVG
ncbi:MULTISPECIES: pilus assembly protein TadG-related protein [unclassified Streptomyces]|uniref:pilus assembly protein TadG-related protein n=1 Tax=unclassified Streptomyces TaxID=2593676 RepID=UPI001F035C95|nr:MULTISPECIES: pilus assembly protein TadG-related protein [unclassified Streptomyces]MCH0563585.1 hypothetical protein [Streptomyces sp. MUM 2J]MCH0570969.1 hypothetical protein [Streptomyces sp. MUM 136J]